MTHKYLTSAVFVLVLAVTLQAESGFVFLELPAVNENGYYRLADMAAPDSGREIGFQHGAWFYESTLSTVHYRKNSWNGGIRFLNIGDIEVRGEQPVDEPLGTTGYYSGILWLGNGRDFGAFRLDTRINLLFERLYYADAKGISADILLSRRLSDMFRASLSLANAGIMEDLDREATQLPFTGRLGITGHYGSGFLSAAAGWHVDGIFFAEALLRMQYRDTASLSISYSSLYSSFHVGPALQFGRYRFSIGKYFNTEDLEYPAMLSVSMGM